MGARLGHGATVVADSLRCPDDASVQTMHAIEVPITRAPGESFAQSMSTYTRVLYLANGLIEAQLEFSDLPSGYAVDSCQGFQSMGDPPTPTARSSWGTLKVGYR
jgi:hypothetical protein